MKGRQAKLWILISRLLHLAHVFIWALFSAIQRIFSIPVVQGHELYLDVPTFSLRSKRIQFSGLRERMLKRFDGWATRFLSTGVKKLSSNLSYKPSHHMLCLVLSYLFRCAKSQSKCVLNLRKLCRPKQHGGMGFQSLSEFNRALLAKQVWKISENLHHLCQKFSKLDISKMWTLWMLN